VALDDFGASMSSLQTLTQLPVDMIKYDGGLLEALYEDTENLESGKALLKSLQVYAESVGIQTIAEQVEIDALVPLLRELGIDYIQGFAVAEPISIDDFLTQSDSMLYGKAA